MQKKEMIGLAEGAVLLRTPYQDAHRLLLTGRLQGEKVGGRWLVTVASVKRLLAERKTPEGECVPA